jgi:hypothetical protein
MTSTVIPAQPNWYVAEYVPGGECNGERWEEKLYLQAIVAWVIKVDEEKGLTRINDVVPVTVENIGST